MGFQIENGILIRYTDEPGVTEVNVPDSVTQIGDRAFAECRLRRIVIPDSVSQIDREAFWKCYGLREVILPKGLTVIASALFGNCRSLASVMIPDGVRSIENWAFSSCTSLQNIVLPESVRKIGFAAFLRCSSLERIRIPDALEVLEDLAFQDTPWLEHHPDVFVMAGTKILCRYQGDDETVTVPPGVRCIATEAFRGCDRVTEVILPDGVERIGTGAFMNCYSLRSVVLPERLREIRKFAFEGCTSLMQLHFPESLAEIGTNALEETAWFAHQPDGIVMAGNIAYRCKGNGTAAVIPASAKRIESRVFYGCRNLRTITLHDDAEQIRADCFEECQADIILKRNGISVRFPYYSRWLVTEAWTVLQFICNKKTEDRRTMFEDTQNGRWKLPMALFLSLACQDDGCLPYLKRNIRKAVNLLTDERDAGTLAALLKLGFVTRKNIDALIDYAIAQGALEIQTMLLHYKEEHIGYTAELFRL